MLFLHGSIGRNFMKERFPDFDSLFASDMFIGRKLQSCSACTENKQYKIILIVSL